MTDSAALLADEVLPAKPTRQWVLSLPFARRFLQATDSEALTRVLGIVYRALSAHFLEKARLTRASGTTGAVALIQRFGSALNLNIHFHLLVLDGAYLVGTEPPVFRRIEPPRQEELQALVEQMAERIGRALERQGILARDAELPASRSRGSSSASSRTGGSGERRRRRRRRSGRGRRPRRRCFDSGER
jgi:hypothetical protein